MDGKEILKWAGLIFLGWIALRWVTGWFAGNINIGDGTVYPGYAYAPPITAPATPVYAWIPPWQHSYRGGRGRGGRGRR